MKPTSRTNPNFPKSSDIGTPTDQPTVPAPLQKGTGGAKDSLKTPPVDSLRKAYLDGRSEGKTLMSDAAFNRVLQADLSPKQYPETFKDLKGWVRAHFALTADQSVTLDLLGENEVRKFQDGAALAAKLNKPLYYQSIDRDPSVAGAKEMTIQDPVVVSQGVSIRAECQRNQLPKLELPNLNLKP
jgi:hypothetical protein